MSALPIQFMQEALHGARASGMLIPSPGAVDGIWGNTTELSLDAYLSGLTPAYHGAVEINDEKQEFWIPDPAVRAGLARHRDQFLTTAGGASGGTVRSQPAMAITPGASEPTTLTIGSGPPTWALATASIGSLLLIGGVVWFFTRRR